MSPDKTLKREQLGYHPGSLGNLVVTNYLEFRWFADGEPERRRYIPSWFRAGPTP